MKSTLNCKAYNYALSPRSALRDLVIPKKPAVHTPPPSPQPFVLTFIKVAEPFATRFRALSISGGRDKENQMKRLEGKVAVVTGGNSGIGLAAAKRLHEEGARVAIAGRESKTLEQAVKSIGNGVVAVQADVAELPDIDRLYTTVVQKIGRI